MLSADDRRGLDNVLAGLVRTPAAISSLSLPAQVAETFGNQVATHVVKFFNKVQLPTPNAHEYTVTADGGMLVFLNPVGCTIDIRCRVGVPVIRHPRALAALGDNNNRQIRIGIYPGVNPVANDNQVDNVISDLNNDGYNLSDDIDDNVGVMPDPFNRLEQPYEIVLDPEAITRMRGVRRKQRSPAEIVRETMNTPQQILLGDLKEAFKKGWTGALRDDGRPMISFWKACMKAHSQGRLVNGWLSAQNEQHNYKNTHEGSKAYAKRWPSHLRHG